MRSGQISLCQSVIQAESHSNFSSECDSARSHSVRVWFQIYKVPDHTLMARFHCVRVWFQIYKGPDHTVSECDFRFTRGQITLCQSVISDLQGARSHSDGQITLCQSEIWPGFYRCIKQKSHRKLVVFFKITSSTRWSVWFPESTRVPLVSLVPLGLIQEITPPNSLINVILKNPTRLSVGFPIL